VASPATSTIAAPWSAPITNQTTFIRPLSHQGQWATGRGAFPKKPGQSWRQTPETRSM
jgi:type II secretory pathway component PulJ